MTTAERLLRAADELLAERAGGQVSVAEICERAQANVAMVKYCFGSKDGMYDALLEDLVTRFVGDLDRLDAQGLPPAEALALNIRAIITRYVRYPYVNRLVNERLLHGDEAAVERVREVFALPMRAWYARVLAEGRKRGEFREVDPTFFFFTVIGTCEFVFSARSWLDREITDELVDEFVEHTTRLVLHGIAARPGGTD